MKYEAKVKYSTISPESGKEKVITENYLIADAETWADAEEQVATQMAKITKEQVTRAIKISDVVDVTGDDGEFFYKAKIGIITADETNGKEKTVKESVLVRANGFKDACDVLDSYVDEILVPVEVISVSKSGIVDIFDENFVAPVVAKECVCYDADDEDGND